MFEGGWGMGCNNFGYDFIKNSAFYVRCAEKAMYGEFFNDFDDDKVDIGKFLPDTVDKNGLREWLSILLFDQFPLKKRIV